MKYLRAFSRRAQQPLSTALALIKLKNQRWPPTITMRQGSEDLWLMDPREGQPCAAYDGRGFASDWVWSADGRRLAYAHQLRAALDDVYVNEIGTRLIRP